MFFLDAGLLFLDQAVLSFDHELEERKTIERYLGVMFIFLFYSYYFSFVLSYWEEGMTSLNSYRDLKFPYLRLESKDGDEGVGRYMHANLCE